MKFALYIALTSIANIATAQMVARALNSDGKYIELHDTPCGVSFSMPLAVTTNNAGKMIRGCWRQDSNTITIRWNDGDMIEYPAGAFDHMIPSAPVEKDNLRVPPNDKKSPANNEQRYSFHRFEV